jgi:hypothetical protein
MNSTVAFRAATILLLSATSLRAQDTLFTQTEKLVVQVTEITDESIRYVYPNETLTNSIAKNVVKKIHFASGRVQEFTQFSNLQQVKSWEDWEKVSLTKLEHEVKGLIRLEEVTSKARGTTGVSNVTRVKDRAYKKLKIETAMLGGAIAFITDEDIEGNRNYGNSTTPAEAFMSGIAYAESVPQASEVADWISRFQTFNHVQTITQGNNAVEPNIGNGSGNVFLPAPEQEGALTYLTTSIDRFNNARFRVTHLQDNSITLLIRDKKNTYNYVVMGR